MSGDPEGDVRAALGEVLDPELGLDVVSLGLIYGIERSGDAVRVVHTLTTPGCPMESHITRGIREAARSVEGVADVETDLVWEPRWHPAMIDDDAW